MGHLHKTRFLKRWELIEKKLKELDLRYSKDEFYAPEDEYELLKQEIRKDALSILDYSHKPFIKEIDLSAELLYCAYRYAQKYTGLKAYPSQTKAAYALFCGEVIDMKTGEGKTLSGLMCALMYMAFEGYKVFMVSANDYLSDRDMKMAKPMFDSAGISCAYRGPATSIQEKKTVYNSSVIYVSNKVFIKDFMESLNAKKREDIFMQYPVMDEVTGLMKMKNCIAIVDEVDSVLIDEGTKLFTTSKEVPADIELLGSALELAQKLSDGDFYRDEERGSYYLSDSGMLKAEAYFKMKDGKYYSPEYRDTRRYIGKALESLYEYIRDSEYAVIEDKVVIINKQTGRLDYNVRYTEGIHQLLELKEDVPVKNDVKAVAGISYPVFYDLFISFSGMSGTILLEEKEIMEQYHKSVIEIEPNFKSPCINHEDTVCMNAKDKEDKIIECILGCHKTGQPVLCVVKNAEEGERYARRLAECSIAVSVLDAKNNTEEAEIFKNAGKKGAVTIATILAGRGVNIVTDEEAERANGLYVIGSEKFFSRRVDDQIKGRTGRQGRFGETAFYISPDDEIARSYAGKLASMSSLEQKIKDIMGDKEDGYGYSQIKKICANAQIERENSDREMRQLYERLFEPLSYEYIMLFSQKNEMLACDDARLTGIMMIMNDRRPLTNEEKCKLMQSREKISDIIISTWEAFFDGDRYSQRMQLHSTVLSDNFILRYYSDNRDRWNDFIETLHKKCLEVTGIEKR